jgi:N-acyl-L-homoserine lactone synthetase
VTRLERVVDAARPLRFDVARDPAEVEAVHRLRYQTVVAAGWASAAEFPDRLERDGDDDRAVHIAGWDGPAMAAAMRLVPPAPGRPLPVEAGFDLQLEPAGRVAEFDRIVVAPGHRQSQHTVLQALLATACLSLWELGCTEVAGAQTDGMLRLYRGLGCPVRVVGPARRYWGEQRHPVMITLDERAVLAIVNGWL